MFSTVKNILYFGVIYSAIRMLVGAISAIYLIARGVDVFDVGMIKAFQAGIILLLDIPLAYIADKKSRKLSVIGATIFSILWLFTMGLANELQTFYIAELFNAISLALFSGSFISYLIDKDIEFVGNNNNIQKIIGKFYKYQHVGMGVAAMLGAAFITVESRWVWFVSGLLLVMLVIISFRLLPEDIPHNVDKNKVSMCSEILRIFKDIATRIEIKWVIVTLLSVMIYYQSIIQFWQITINSNMQDLIMDGYIYGSIFVVILFAQSYSAHLVEKLSRKSISYVVIVATTLLFFYPIFSKFNYLYSTAVVIVVLFFLVRLIMLTLQSIVHENIASKLRASYDSVISTIIRLLLLVIIPLLGFAINKFGFMPLYLAYLVISFIVFVVFIRARQHLTKC